MIDGTTPSSFFPFQPTTGDLSQFVYELTINRTRFTRCGIRDAAAGTTALDHPLDRLAIAGGLSVRAARRNHNAVTGNRLLPVRSDSGNRRRYNPIASASHH